MNDNRMREQHLRHCMLYEYQLGNNATNATKNINSVYEHYDLKVRKCQSWFSKFRNGDFSLQDVPRSGRPSTTDNDVLKAIVDLEPTLTIDEISKKIGASWSCVQEHLALIGKVSRAGTWVPHNLTEDQKLNRISTCNSLLMR